MLASGLAHVAGAGITHASALPDRQGCCSLILPLSLSHRHVAAGPRDGKKHHKKESCKKFLVVCYYLLLVFCYFWQMSGLCKWLLQLWPARASPPPRRTQCTAVLSTSPISPTGTAQQVQKHRVPGDRKGCKQHLDACLEE